MSISIGLDLSATGTGIVVLGPPKFNAVGCNPKLLVEYQVPTKELLGMKRVDAIMTKIMDLREQHTPSRIVVEDYAIGKFAGSSLPAIEVGAILRYMMFAHKQPIILVPPTQVKQFASGKGNSKKSEMMMHVLARWGHTSKTDNTADAYALSAIGLAHVGSLLGVSHFQKEIIGTLKMKIP